MGKASSSKKVARAARAGGRSAANRQRNLLFPGVIGLIILLGIGLVWIAADDYKSETQIPPVIGDHWHAAIGFSICGEFQPDLSEFDSRVGVHTHGDGVIHIHPSSEGGAGENATLGTFLEGAGVTLTDTSLTIGDETWEEGETQCDGEDAELVVAQWKDIESTSGEPALIRRDFDSIRFRDDGEGYTIAFVPEGSTDDIPKPESAAQLTALGAADGGDVATPEGETPSTTAGAAESSDTTVAPTDTTTPPTETTVPAG